jgi:hypothetical protein
VGEAQDVLGLLHRQALGVEDLQLDAVASRRLLRGARRGLLVAVVPEDEEQADLAW